MYNVFLLRTCTYIRTFTLCKGWQSGSNIRTLSLFQHTYVVTYVFMYKTYVFMYNVFLLRTCTYIRTFTLCKGGKAAPTYVRIEPFLQMRLSCMHGDLLPLLHVHATAPCLRLGATLVGNLPPPSYGMPHHHIISDRLKPCIESDLCLLPYSIEVTIRVLIQLVSLL